VFKRLSWLTVGTGFGFGLAVWLRRALRARIERYRPAQVSAGLTKKLRRLGDDVRAAALEGRSAMRDREAELRRSHPEPPAP
jgi:hypothetical protein